MENRRVGITVKKHWAEKFIDWFPLNTKLYVRGERGKNREETNKLYRDLFDQLAPFFDRVRNEAFEEIEKDLKKFRKEEYNRGCDDRMSDGSPYVVDECLIIIEKRKRFT